MCQFHQRQIITRYLTRKPKSIASQTLLELSKTLTTTTKQDFRQALDSWYLEHESYLNERTVIIDENHKMQSWYTHKRLRSAYKSLRTNLPYLFTYQKDALNNTPNTTKLEGLFTHLKQSLRCYQGLSKHRKIKFIDDFMLNYKH